MLVYRVEHTKTKRGPFRRPGRKENPGLEWAGVSTTDPSGLLHNREYRRYPVMYTKRGWRVGCPSAQSLRDWFWMYATRLDQAGYIVRVYRVPERWIERRVRFPVAVPQLAFRNSKAEFRAEFSILDL